MRELSAYKNQDLSEMLFGVKHLPDQYYQKLFTRNSEIRPPPQSQVSHALHILYHISI